MSLVIDQVTKRYGSHVAVNQLSLEIPERQMFGLLGANGAGKTTTIRMILGLLDPTEGRIGWNNEAINYENSDLIGYLPEERGLYPKLTVKEQLTYLAQLKGMQKREITASIEDWLERFRITEYLHKKVEELSKGNQQKIQFIAAVLHNPKLLFLDEPFSGLDPVNVELLKGEVQKIAQQGTSIIFSSHRMDHVEELCQNICILHHGSPVVQGNLKEIKRSYGRTKLRLDTEDSFDQLSEWTSIKSLQKTAYGYQLETYQEKDAQQILKYVAEQGFITHFSITEPSLHDIFIEKVGAIDE